jgi:LmbE family N-acetylglucosaminyl deacetylase
VLLEFGILPMDPSLFSTRVGGAQEGPWLVIAAHPDDEVIGASWLMNRAPELVVVHVTDGAPEDPRLRPQEHAASRAQYAEVRRGEAETALRCLDVPRVRTLTLGVTDQRAAEHLTWIAEQLTELLLTLRPSLLITHCYEGGHPDHDATAFAVRAALACAQRWAACPPRLCEMTSYHGAEGRFAAGAFPSWTGPELRVQLGVQAQQVKRAMFRAHASQAALLSAFGVAEERYRWGAPCDFAHPPHPGLLYYEQRGWGMAGARFRELARAAQRALHLGRGSLP